MASFVGLMGKVLNTFDKSAGKTLMILNTLGIGFAAASNTVAAATDKNTSPEDKKFLVPAGLLTGVANVGLYFGMTSKLVSKLSGTGKNEGKGIADKVISSMINKNTFDENALKYVDGRILKAGKKFGETHDYFTSMKQTLKNGDALTEAGKDLYKNHIKDGMGVLGAFIGAVIGCAVITPIFRDVSAYIVQKVREKKNPSLQDKPYMPYFDPTHIGPKYGKYNKQPLSLTSYMAFTHGRTRI